MKLSLVQVLMTCIWVNLTWATDVTAQELLDRRVTIQAHEEKVKTVLSQLARVANVKFSYSPQLIQAQRKISFQAVNSPLSEVLNRLLPTLQLTYSVAGNQIILKQSGVSSPTSQPADESLNAAVADPSTDQTITGTVTDDKGQAVPGVNIVVKGTPRGTTSDATGTYQITVPNAEAVLVFSSVGFITQEVSVGNRSSISITLKSDDRSLNEVVVVGYGTQKKSDVTGSVASISAKEISELPLTSPQQALQGRVPGIDVVATGTNPGAGVNVRIRGRRSFAAGNDPLFIVDGIPFAGGLNDINPQDIQSMEVLKDASATAIYGSRGANGVVLITTKRGKEGRVTVSYDAYYGVAQASGKVRVLNGSEWTDWKREWARAQGRYNDSNPTASDAAIFSADELEGIRTGRSTDWQSLLLKNGHQQNHQISVLGGSATTKFAIAANYFNDEGVIKGLDFNRYSLRVNLDQQLGKRFKVGTSTFVSYSLQNGDGFEPLYNARLINPLSSPYNADGTLNFRAGTESLITNPLNEIVDGAVIREDKRSRIFSSLYAEVRLLDGLTLRTNFGPDYQTRRRGEFNASLTSARNGGDASATVNNYNTLAYTLENILNYSKTFKTDHSLNFTGLYSIQRQTDESSGTGVQGVPIDAMSFNNLGAAPRVSSYSSGYSQWTIVSYMARANYAYKDKYLLTLTGRMDGSSRFAEGKKYGLFPSVALGWRIIEENFLKNQRLLSNLKLRASYGQTGNTGISPYTTLGNLTRTTYAFGNTGVYGYAPNNLVNPNLTWETTASTNLGLDFGFLNERISGSIDVYEQNTRDLLLNRNLPTTSGTSNVILQNIGKTRNRGIEISLSTTNLSLANGFRWTTDLNFYKNREEIVDLYGDKKDDVGNLWFIGQPLTAYFDYQKIGIWQLGEESEATKYRQIPGSIKVADVASRDANGNAVPGADGRITAEDRVVLGSDVPTWSGGITNRIEFKNFDLSIFVFTRQGGMIQSGLRYGYGDGRFNETKTDYWTPTNPTNATPRPGSLVSPYASTLNYFDGSFVKVRNIQLGYNLPAKLASRLKMQSLRVYVSAQNPFVFAQYRTKYYGVDPEFARTPSGGAERNSLSAAGTNPSTRLVLFGLNLKF